MQWLNLELLVATQPANWLSNKERLDFNESERASERSIHLASFSISESGKERTPDLGGWVCFAMN